MPRPPAYLIRYAPHDPECECNGLFPGTLFGEYHLFRHEEGCYRRLDTILDPSNPKVRLIKDYGFIKEYQYIGGENERSSDSFAVDNLPNGEEAQILEEGQAVEKSRVVNESQTEGAKEQQVLKEDHKSQIIEDPQEVNEVQVEKQSVCEGKDAEDPLQSDEPAKPAASVALSNLNSAFFNFPLPSISPESSNYTPSSVLEDLECSDSDEEDEDGTDLSSPQGRYSPVPSTSKTSSLMSPLSPISLGNGAVRDQKDYETASTRKDCEKEASPVLSSVLEDLECSDSDDDCTDLSSPKDNYSPVPSTSKASSVLMASSPVSLDNGVTRDQKDDQTADSRQDWETEASQFIYTEPPNQPAVVCAENNSEVTNNDAAVQGSSLCAESLVSKAVEYSPFEKNTGMELWKTTKVNSSEEESAVISLTSSENSPVKLSMNISFTAPTNELPADEALQINNPETEDATGIHFPAQLGHTKTEETCERPLTERIDDYYDQCWICKRIFLNSHYRYSHETGRTDLDQTHGR